MKKIVIVIVVVLVGFVIVVQVVLKDNIWYVGGKLGWFQYYDIGFYGNGFQNNNGLICNDQFGVGVFGGYQVNLYFGFEMGYDWLGCMVYKGSVDNGVFKVQGVQLIVKLGYLIIDDLDIYICLGGMVWCVDFKGNYVFIGVFCSEYDIGVFLVFVGGVEWVVICDIVICLEYQWVNNIGDVGIVGICFDNGMLSLGVFYCFGQEDVVLVVVLVLVLVLEVVIKYFILKFDVLFNFNKVILKLEGQQVLDQLYIQLSNMDLKDGFVVVLGYIDCIGFEVYNQQLFEKCVQFVVDYLVVKGILVGKIFVCGMGEFNLVIGNICDNVKVCVVLIDCLVLDCCVEIEVKGYKEVVIQLVV